MSLHNYWDTKMTMSSLFDSFTTLFAGHFHWIIKNPIIQDIVVTDECKQHTHIRIQTHTFKQGNSWVSKSPRSHRTAHIKCENVGEWDVYWRIHYVVTSKFKAFFFHMGKKQEEHEKKIQDTQRWGKMCVC